MSRNANILKNALTRISLSSQSSMGGTTRDLGFEARRALEEYGDSHGPEIPLTLTPTEAYFVKQALAVYKHVATAEITETERMGKVPIVTADYVANICDGVIASIPDP